MDYMPLVKSLHCIGGLALGDRYVALMFDDIESAGVVQYTYLLGVFDKETAEPMYFVSSEPDWLGDSDGIESHCLGVFDTPGHLNLGLSDDWGDPEKFFPEAIRLAAARFDVPLDESDAPPFDGE